MTHFQFVLFVSVFGCAKDAGDTGGDGYRLFDEAVSQGLGDYLGTASPTGSETVFDSTRYDFDQADGPMCYRGEPFSMFTRAGTSDDLIVFLQGGGACWSGLCQAFENVVDQVGDVGILNRGLEDNPVADWNVGYVPYCDGSLFVGDADVDEDGDGETDRYHRGLQNLSASLDVIRDVFPNPGRILVVGSSAGAYGTPVASMLVRHAIPDVRIDVVADAGLGLGRPGDDDFLTEVLDEWGVTRFVPESCTDCLRDGHATGVTDYMLRQDPNMHAYAISSLGDMIIGTMFLGLDADSYADALRDETERLEEAHPGRYSSFLFEGRRHTTVSVDSSLDLATLTDLPVDVNPEVLAEWLGTFDETRIDGENVATWLSGGLNNAVDFGSRTD